MSLRKYILDKRTFISEESKALPEISLLPLKTEGQVLEWDINQNYKFIKISMVVHPINNDSNSV